MSFSLFLALFLLLMLAFIMVVIVLPIKLLRRAGVSVFILYKKGLYVFATVLAVSLIFGIFMGIYDDEYMSSTESFSGVPLSTMLNTETEQQFNAMKEEEYLDFDHYFNYKVNVLNENEKFVSERKYKLYRFGIRTGRVGQQIVKCPIFRLETAEKLLLKYYSIGNRLNESRLFMFFNVPFLTMTLILFSLVLCWPLLAISIGVEILRKVRKDLKNRQTITFAAGIN